MGEPLGLQKELDQAAAPPAPNPNEIQDRPGKTKPLNNRCCASA